MSFILLGFILAGVYSLAVPYFKMTFAGGFIGP
jgi:hypothetical protein